MAILFIKPYAEPALAREMQETHGAQHRNVHLVHEDASTGVTQQLPARVRVKHAV